MEWLKSKGFINLKSIFNYSVSYTPESENYTEKITFFKMQPQGTVYYPPTEFENDCIEYDKTDRYNEHPEDTENDYLEADYRDGQRSWLDYADNEERSNDDGWYYDDYSD
jgi:hypothetical protein